MSLMVLLFAVLSPARAAPVGTYTVSSWDFAIDGGEARTVYFKIHYPAVGTHYGADADPSGGPFPVVGFMHGYLGSAWMYTDTADALASMGAVVVNLDIETTVSINTTRMALGMEALLWWVDDSSQDPDHWLSGMSDGGDWSVGAHSMGGVALAELVGLEPRVQTVIGYMPYEPDGEQWLPYESFTGTALMLAGSEDETSTPDMVALWHERLSVADRSLYLELEGAGHQAVSNFEWGGETMSDADQNDLVVALSADLLESTWTADDRLYQSLLCDLSSPAVVHRSKSQRPITIAEPEDDTTVALSIAGRPETEAVVFGGRGPDATETELGTIGLREAVVLGRVPLPEGIACGDFPLPVALAGLGWVQVAHVADDGAVVLGEALDVFGVGDPGALDEPEPDDEDRDEDIPQDDGVGDADASDEPDGLDGSDAATSASTGGSSARSKPSGKVSSCSTAGGGAGALVAGLMVVASRRRR